MKRLAMIAVLAAVGGSLAPTISWAQAVQGYSKFTMKDQTRPDPSEVVRARFGIYRRVPVRPWS